MAYLLEEPEEIESEEALTGAIEPVLYAYSIRYGLAALIERTFADNDELWLLAAEWLDDEERAALEEKLGAAPCRVQDLLDAKINRGDFARIFTYGIENYLDDVRILARWIDDFERSPAQAINASEFRGRSLNVTVQLESLVRLMLLYAEEIFQGENEQLDLAFEGAISECNQGLDPSLKALHRINEFFEFGESSHNRRKRKKSLRSKLKILEEKRKTIELNGLRKSETYWKRKEEKNEAIKQIQIQLDDCDELSERNYLLAAETKLRYEIKQIENEHNALRKTQEDRLCQVDEDIIIERQKDADEDNRTVKFSKQIQQICLRRIGRRKPFEGFMFEQITAIKKNYRNPITHMHTKSIEEVIEELGIDPIRRLVRQLERLLESIRTENFCPQTYIFLGTVRDLDYRPVLVFTNWRRNAQDEPYFSVRHVKWVYPLSGNIEYQPGKPYFILSQTSDEVLFEPTCVPSEPLVERLKGLLPKIESEQPTDD